MLRTASSLPLTGLLTLGSDPARFQTEPPACYRASWQLPGPDSHRQATTSLRTARSTMAYVTVSPPALLGARIIEARARIFYKKLGSSGVPLLFIHGGGCTHSDWEKQLEGLEHDHVVVACDLRGHGQSAETE